MKNFIRLISTLLLFSMFLCLICACGEYYQTDYNDNDNEDEKTDTTITKDKEDEKTDITITKDKEELIGQNYKKVEEYFKNLGFTDIEFLTYSYDSGIIDGEVTDIAIVDWIFKEKEFSSGDVFAADCKIKISYNKLKIQEEEEQEAPLFYSTNNYEEAKKGNTGVFSYKNKKGSYDVYWIIDFDEGYVYFFTDGNGETACDKLEIASGDLNNRITIKWDQETAWYLHFKYVEHPETLVVKDHIFQSQEFTTTDLDDALIIRANKTIYEW